MYGVRVRRVNLLVNILSCLFDRQWIEHIIITETRILNFCPLAIKVYIQDLLIRTNIKNRKPATTPMISTSKLYSDQGDLSEDNLIYKSTMGALITVSGIIFWRR